jgi:hypothetical protein
MVQRRHYRVAGSPWCNGDNLAFVTNPSRSLASTRERSFRSATRNTGSRPPKGGSSYRPTDIVRYRNHRLLLALSGAPLRASCGRRLPSSSVLAFQAALVVQAISLRSVRSTRLWFILLGQLRTRVSVVRSLAFFASWRFKTSYDEDDDEAEEEVSTPIPSSLPAFLRDRAFASFR